jgi:hypothetical protein
MSVIFPGEIISSGSNAKACARNIYHSGRLELSGDRRHAQPMDIDVSQIQWRVRRVEDFVVTNLRTAVVAVPLLDIVGQMMQCRFTLKRDPRVFTRSA